VLEQDDGTYAVAAEVEASLNVAVQEIVGDYCRWLTRREEEIFDQLLEATEWIHQRQQEVAGLHAQIGELERQNQELSLTLDRIFRGNTWRLRTLVHRALQRGRTAVARTTSRRA
jgi:hypothetical protein